MLASIARVASRVGSVRRTWLTERFLADWLKDQAHYRMQLLDRGTDNPDQRIAEDVRSGRINAILVTSGSVAEQVLRARVEDRDQPSQVHPDEGGSGRRVTWVCLMGMSRIYPWLRFQASEELKDYGPEDLEAHEAEDVRPKKVESI